MTTIVTRAGKGSPLTNNEVDANFVNLNNAIIANGVSGFVRTSFAATAGQTDFIFSYTAPYVLVWVNGVLLGTSDYTATTGTSVVFNSPCVVGDLVECVALSLGGGGGGGGGGTITSVSGTAPVASSGGTNPVISMPAATSSANGYLTSTDWTTFNSKQNLLSSGSNIKTVGGFTVLGAGDVGTIGVGYGGTGLTSPGANGNVLTSNGTAWVSSTPTSGGGGTITAVTGTAPVVSSGGTTPVISMAAATGSDNGYLTSTDWTTFNSKQNLLVSGTNIKTVGGFTVVGTGDVGTIGAAYGGTGLTTSGTTAGWVLTANGTGGWIAAAPGASAGVSSFSGGSTGLLPSTATGGVVTLSGTLNIANGGTGATTASAARTALGVASIDFTNVSRTVNKIGSSGVVSTYATAQNPLAADGRKRIIAGRDFGLALDGSTNDAPALNDMIQKVGARGGGYIDIAADMTAGGSAYMKILSSINNNVPGVTVRGTHFPSWSAFRDAPISYPSGVSIIPSFNGIACYHFTPFSNTANQITGGGFEHLNVIGGQTGSGSSQELLRVDGVCRGSYIMNLMYPAGPTCARFIARDPAFISGTLPGQVQDNTSIQYAHVDLYCRAYPGYGEHPLSNPDAHGVIMQSSETWGNANPDDNTGYGRSGNISLNKDWRILFEGVNGKALWNRCGDANVGFTVIGGQAGQPGVSDFIWGSTGSGGSPGTYTLSFSGGTDYSIVDTSVTPPVTTYFPRVAPTGTFVVGANGKIKSVTITSCGANYDKSAAPPTVSFSAAPGLTGASATCVIGVILYYADGMGKSKASILGGQSQGFKMISGGNMPVILEGTEAPNVGALLSVGDGAASTITSAFIDTGNGQPQIITGTKAFASRRDIVYAVDYGFGAARPVFGLDQPAVYFGKQAASSTAAFTATSRGVGGGLGTAAEFLFYGNAMSVRLEDDSATSIKLKDYSNVLSTFRMHFGLELKPGIGVTQDPTLTGGMTFETNSNTLASIKVKGSDGVVRKAGLALSVDGDLPATLSSAIPASVGAQTAGVATTASRSDHVHDHGNQTAGTHHAAATTSVNGFMSSTDKTKLDNIAAPGTVGNVLTSNGTAWISSAPSAGTGSFGALSYSTTFTGGTGVVNIGSGQIYKDATGNVGIGTVSPGEKLSIAGSANVFMSLLTTGVIKTQFFATDANGQGGVNTVTNHPFTIGANNDPKVIVQPNGNVGIGNVGAGFTPAASAVLDVQSTSAGVRFPNMTTTQKNAISSPALGLVVFDTTLAKLCVYTGTWQTITSA